MPFYEALTEKIIPPEAKVIAPISLGQIYHAGTYVKAKLALLKSFTSMVLVADSLYRFNTTLEDALKKGDQFLQENAGNLHSLRVQRWDDWISRPEFQEKKSLLEARIKAHPQLEAAIVETARQALSGADEELSIKYIIEECAVYLMWWRYDYVFYPRPLSAALAALYEYFPEFKLPEFCLIKYQETLTDVTALKHHSVFHKSSKDKSLPLILRQLSKQLEEVLESDEISPKHKQQFASAIKSSLTVKLSVGFAKKPKLSSIELPNPIVAEESVTPNFSSSVL